MKQNATLDSSFWINAHRSGLLPYLNGRFRIHYPRAVADELMEEFASGREFWNQVRQGFLLEAVSDVEQVAEFGLGERAAINLALGHRDWVLLIDDQRPFVEAVRLQIQVLCTPVLVVELFLEQALDARQALGILARLAAMQTVSPNLIAAALAQLGRAHKAEEEN